MPAIPRASASPAPGLSVGGDRAAISAISLLLALVCALAGCATNKVQVSNTSNTENGVLVSDGFTVQLSQSYLGNATLFDVGARQGNGEVFGFTRYRPVASRTVNWPNDPNPLPMPFSGEVFIPVKVWIVKGPFAAQQQLAVQACITTSSIWDNERMGVAFSPFQVVDSTGNAKASTYYTFDCSKQAAMENDIGKTAGRINIYFVDTVDGGTGRGNACAIGSDFVAVGSAIGTELLSHELGHDFALTHIDDLTTNFDQTNIMHSASNTRQYITEGQLFRAHLRSDSALNFLYNARPGQMTRNCDRDTFDKNCPAIQKRIWADGSFPAN
jgi:hypothetical protein